MLTFFSRILVAYDGSPLSHKALDQAIKLAEQDKRIEIHVVTIWDHLDQYNYLEKSEESVQITTDKLFDKVKEELGRIPNKSITVTLEGNPASMIVQYANNRDCDLIVMGSRGLSDFKELFLGSVSHNVVQHAHCPVFILK